MNWLKQNWIKLGLFILIYLFLGINNSFATSGACSYHQGANCSIQTSRGYAVCNDGFVSSVYYSDMEECEIVCSYPRYGSGCNTEIDYQLLEMDLTSELEDAENRVHYGGFVTRMELEDLERLRHQNTLLLLQCRGQISSYEQAVREYEICHSNMFRSIPTIPDNTPTPFLTIQPRISFSPIPTLTPRLSPIITHVPLPTPTSTPIPKKINIPIPSVTPEVTIDKAPSISLDISELQPSPWYRRLFKIFFSKWFF